MDSNKVVQAGWEPIAQPFAIETLPQKLAADKKSSHTNSEGFWAGEGNAASGILPVCPSKGTVCLAMRSELVHMGGCWGTIGGAIIEDMSPAESAKEELAEETGYTGGLTLVPAYVFTSGGGFKYHNYIGIVPTEFSLNPQKGGTGKLKHSDETDYISWVPWQNVLDDVMKSPDDYHPGMRKMLVESKDEIEKALQIPKTASETIQIDKYHGQDCFKCNCGGHKFEYSDETGNRPAKWTLSWLGRYVTCKKCGRIVECETLKVVGIKGIKEKQLGLSLNKKEAATPRMAPEPPAKPLTRQQVKKLVDDAAEVTYETPKTLDPTQTPEFKRWFGKSKVVNPDGTPKVVYHGSTHVFEKFDISRAGADSYYGKGFYFTDSKVDVSKNYGTSKGPDLLRNIEFRAERILDEIQDELGETFSYGDPRYDEFEAQAKQRAQKELSSPTQGVVYLTYLKMERPLVVKSPQQTHFEIIYDDTDEAVYEETGSGGELWEACMAAGDELGTDGQGVWTRAMEHIGDSEFSAEQFENAVRQDVEMTDDEVYAGTFLSHVYQIMGFDGIIMHDADKQFSNMGLERGTAHYIVWNSRQIKSAIGNSGKFSPRSPRITAKAELKSFTVAWGRDQWTVLGQWITEAKNEMDAKRQCRQWLKGTGYHYDGMKVLYAIENTPKHGISKKEAEGTKPVPNEIVAAFEGQTRWEKMLDTEKDKWIGPAWERLRKDPWVEFVPISQLLPLREYEWDREYNRHGPEEFDELVEDTKQHGTREPITIRYFPDTNRAIIIEGNHRVSAAEKAGFVDVPARVTIASYKQEEYGHATEGGPVSGRTTKEKPYQDYIKPSDIGLNGSKTTKSTVKTAADKFGLEHPIWSHGKFLCPCGHGNSNDEEAFRACDRQGNRVDVLQWDATKYYLCNYCQRIFKKVGKEGENNDGSNDVVIGFSTRKNQFGLFGSIEKEARPTQQKIDLIKSQYNLDDQTVEQIIQSDPTERDYVAWIAKQVAANRIKLPEDTAKTKQQLTTFTKLKRSPQFTGNKDISAYDPSMLFAMLEENANQLSNKEQRRETVHSGAEVVVESGDFKIYKVSYDYKGWLDTIRTKDNGSQETSDAMQIATKALMELSGGTNWCTAHPSQAKYYLSEGPSYVMFYKGSAYAQLHVESDQYMDRTDEPLNEQYTMRTYDPNVNVLRGMIVDRVAQQFIDLLAPIAPEVKEWAKDYDAKKITPDNLKELNLENRVRWSLATGNRLSPDDEKNMIGPRDSGRGWYRDVNWMTVNNYIAAFEKTRNKAHEDDLLVTFNPSGQSMDAVLDYCRKVIHGRWPEFEELVREKMAWFGNTRTLGGMIVYCKEFMGGRWPALESLINQAMRLGNEPDTARKFAVEYARDVIKAPWPLADKTMGENIEEQLLDTIDQNSIKYAASVMKQRWPQLEQLLLVGGDHSYLGRSKEVQREVSPTWALCVEYAAQVIKGPWPELEDKILNTPNYASGFGKWSIPNPKVLEQYVAEARKSRWPEFEEHMLSFATGMDSAKGLDEPWRGVLRRVGTAYATRLANYLDALKTIGQSWPEGEKLMNRLFDEQAKLKAEYAY